MESNNLLTITYLLFLAVQTAIPTYGLKVKYEIIDIYVTVMQNIFNCKPRFIKYIESIYRI